MYILHILVVRIFKRTFEPTEKFVPTENFAPSQHWD
jgi:hypothetical protein